MRIRTFVIRSTVALAAVTAQMASAQNDWPAYGRDPGAQRYSPLKQINPGNVSKLVQSWSFQTRPSSETGAKRISSTTPLMINNVLYFATPYQSLVADWQSNLDLRSPACPTHFAGARLLAGRSEQPTDYFLRHRRRLPDRGKRPHRQVGPRLR